LTPAVRKYLPDFGMSTTSRGYGNKHQRLRKAFAAAVEVGAVWCSRCGKLIEAGEKWDLGHDDHDRSVYTGPEHQKCNRSTAARREQSGVRHSREW